VWACRAHQARRLPTFFHGSTDVRTEEHDVCLPGARVPLVKDSKTYTGPVSSRRVLPQWHKAGTPTGTKCIVRSPPWNSSQRSRSS
jgi:hypothetical protein